MAYEPIGVKRIQSRYPVYDWKTDMKSLKKTVFNRWSFDNDLSAEWSGSNIPSYTSSKKILNKENSLIQSKVPEWSDPYGYLRNKAKQYGARITSNYGDNHSSVSGEKFHRGIDVSFWDSNVHQLFDNGIVTRVGTDKYYGNFVQVKNPETGRIIQYGHMARAPYVKEGQTLKEWDIIGYQGVPHSQETSGASTAAHTDVRYVNWGTGSGSVNSKIPKTPSTPTSSSEAIKPSLDDPMAVYEYIRKKPWLSNQEKKMYWDKNVVRWKKEKIVYPTGLDWNYSTVIQKKSVIPEWVKNMAWTINSVLSPLKSIIPWYSQIQSAGRALGDMSTEQTMEYDGNQKLTQAQKNKLAMTFWNLPKYSQPLSRNQLTEDETIILFD